MPYDFDEYRALAQQVGAEHREAIADSQTTGKEVAQAESNYRKLLARAVVVCKHEHGATVAEAIAKGEDDVADAHEAMEDAKARDRTAMEKVRLARDDRAVLLTLGAWSKAQEGWEQ